MNLIYKVESKKSLINAVNDLKDSLSEYKFGVLWELDFKEKLKEKGVDINHDIIILEVCNPKRAKNLIEKNVEVAFFLPCKVVVYEQNNTVFMGMINPIELINYLEDSRLIDEAKAVGNDIQKALHQAK